MTEVAMSAPADEAGVIVTAETPTEISENDSLGAIFDKYERDNGAARDPSGRFASDKPVEVNSDAAAVEGKGDGEAAPEGVEPEQAAADAKPSVPLPPTLTGLDEAWAKIPPEAQEAIAASQQKLHKNMSDMGRALASYKPVNDVITEFKEYFGGERGTYKPDEAIRFLFGLQRSMDDNPMGTLLEIANTYNLTGELQKRFGGAGTGEGQQQQDYTNELLAKIDGLERHIRQISDPSRVDERINARLNEEKARQAEEKNLSDMDEVINRTATKEAMPLYAEAEKYLPQIIPIAAQKLGGSAAPADLLKLAYDMAVNADPDLRKKAAALVSAAQPDAKRVADARKANATNIRSTSTGSPREMTEEEALNAIWEKHKRA